MPPARQWSPWYLLPPVLGLLTAIVLWGCAGGAGTGSGGTTGVVRQDIAVGDRQKDWALVYYQSWRRDGKSTYLQLARNQMAQAIRTYFAIQVRIGHSFPDFYNIDRKRREGCRFLREMDRDASKFRVTLADLTREGCLR